MALFKIYILVFGYVTINFFILEKLLKKNKYEILRFIISGFISTSINFLVYISLYSIFKNILFASLFGYSTGLLSSFILAKIWVFKDISKKRIFKSFFIFCLIYFLGGLEMSLIIFFMNQLVNNYKFSWLCGTFISALNNYLGSKYFLFKK